MAYTLRSSLDLEVLAAADTEACALALSEILIADGTGVYVAAATAVEVENADGVCTNCGGDLA